MKRALALFALGLLAAAPAPAATRFEPYPLSPEVGAYVFIADLVDASRVFLNPGAIGNKDRRDPPQLYFDLSGDDRGPNAGSAAFLSGFMGVGYRHRDTGGSFDLSTTPSPVTIDVPEGNFDSYVVAAGAGARWLSAGVAREWTKSDLRGWDYSSWSVGLASRPHRRLSLAGTMRDLNEPSIAGGKLPATFTYGLALRPLPQGVERLTLNVEASHPNGSSQMDMAYGARYVTDKGYEVGFVVQDPNGGDLEFGGSVTARWGQGSASVRGRFPKGPWDPSPRWQGAVRTYDAYLRDSVPVRRKVATLTLSGEYDDTPSGFVLAGGESRGTTGLVRRIRDAAADRDIRALALRIEGLDGAFLGPVSAQLEEIREAIQDFRGAGKPVVSYLGQMANGPAEVYLASVADRIVLTPMGGVHSFGVSVHLLREKRFFEKLGVAWEADTAGVYKSSFHGFYTDTTSALQRAAIQGLVDDAQRYLVDVVQEARDLSDVVMDDLATGRVVFPEECVSLKLVDRLGWWEDALRETDRLAGGDGESIPPSVPLPDRRYLEERWVPPPAVAVVLAEGSIRSGESGRNWILGGRSMGARTVAQQLRAAARQPDVRALVLRVDSGGGSALASEEIRQAILRVKRESRLPLFVSMGTAAASGGYLMSAPADTIFANRMTRTGSIGVVWAVPVVEDLYRKLGITSETYRTGEHTDMFRGARPMTESERAMLDAALDATYGRFVSAVAEGRGLPESRVRELAEGRVYFGEQARALGLVDAIGSLDDAVAAAATTAGIEDDYRVLTVRPATRGFVDRAWRLFRFLGTALDALLPGSDAEMLEDE